MLKQHNICQFFKDEIGTLLQQGKCI